MHSLKITSRYLQTGIKNFYKKLFKNPGILILYTEKSLTSKLQSEGIILMSSLAGSGQILISNPL